MKRPTVAHACAPGPAASSDDPEAGMAAAPGPGESSMPDMEPGAGEDQPHAEM